MECGNVSCGGGDGRKKVILMSLFDDCGLVGGACSGTYVLVTFFLSVSVCLKPDTPSYAYSLSEDQTSYATDFMVLCLSLCVIPLSVCLSGQDYLTGHDDYPDT